MPGNFTNENFNWDKILSPWTKNRAWKYQAGLVISWSKKSPGIKNRYLPGQSVLPNTFFRKKNKLSKTEEGSDKKNGQDTNCVTASSILISSHCFIISAGNNSSFIFPSTTGTKWLLLVLSREIDLFITPFMKSKPALSSQAYPGFNIPVKI